MPNLGKAGTHGLSRAEGDESSLALLGCTVTTWLSLLNSCANSGIVRNSVRSAGCVMGDGAA